MRSSGIGGEGGRAEDHLSPAMRSATEAYFARLLREAPPQNRRLSLVEGKIVPILEPIGEPLNEVLDDKKED